MTTDIAVISPSAIAVEEYGPTYLRLRLGLTYDDWARVGETLGHMGRGIQWWIGDWLKYGEHSYGEKYAQAAKLTGLEIPALKQYQWVADRIDEFTRVNLVPWSTHREVAALPRDQQIAILSQAAPLEGEDSPQLTQREVRDLARDYAKAISPPPALPAGTYDLIYADPPWRYEFVEAKNRAIENHYPTMTLDEIKALELPRLAPDALLLLWATPPKLDEAIQVMREWGFSYRSCLVWVKHAIGMGYWARQRHELLLVGRLGEFSPPPESERPDSVIESPREAHSKKPEQVYALIERMFPAARKIELFSRRERDGWAAWGNQVADAP